MSASKPVFLIESNDFAAEKLRRGLDLHGVSGAAQILTDASDVVDSAVIRLTLPIRVGAVIEQILHFQRSVSSAQEDFLSFGPCRLDRFQGLFYNDGSQSPIRLTEKEVSLLALLHEAGGESVSRETLLDKIWQYAENVETHTLETHIYRLRQKIEADPAEPRILRTSDMGYFLSFESV